MNVLLLIAGRQACIMFRQRRELFHGGLHNACQPKGKLIFLYEVFFCQITYISHAIRLYYEMADCFSTEIISHNEDNLRQLCKWQIFHFMAVTTQLAGLPLNYNKSTLSGSWGRA
jgi:hypothetical protein